MYIYAYRYAACIGMSPLKGVNGEKTRVMSINHTGGGSNDRGRRDRRGLDTVRGGGW